MSHLGVQVEIIFHLTNSEMEGYEQDFQSDLLFNITNSPLVERNPVVDVLEKVRTETKV